MKLKVKNPPVDKKEINQVVSDLVNSSHRDDFMDICVWTIKTGLGEKDARKKLINEISEGISKEIGHGLVQITVQELEDETEIKSKIEKRLPAIYLHIDYIIKSGAFDVLTKTYWFKVTSNVMLDNLAIRLKKGEITRIKSGTMQAFVTLAYCGQDRENASPFTLFKNKKVIDLELPKVIELE